MNFIEAIEDVFNISVTENGAEGYKSTGKALLDMNFKVPSYRAANTQSIINDFEAAFYENPKLAIKWAFMLRDARGGMGERRIFRIIMKHLADTIPFVMKELMKLFPEYGRWDDLLCLEGTSLESKMFEMLGFQLNLDVTHMKQNKNVSLLAKWLPSENASSKETIRLAKRVRKHCGMDSKTYRKTLSALRSYIDVVERKMSANKWTNINYEAVPSKANLIYANSFMKHDSARRAEYLEALKNGEAKINAAVLYPHEIVHKYDLLKGYDTGIREESFNQFNEDLTLEELWKGLAEYTVDKQILVVRDGSGSMKKCIGNSKTTALDVSTALALYCAERCKGPYKDSFITFSSHPALVKLKENMSLKDRLLTCNRYDDCSNTNIEAVFDLVLKAAVRNNLTQKELPDSILIISDMEFDVAQGEWNNPTFDFKQKRLFETISDSFQQAGYKMPRLVFWNVNSRTNTIPVSENENGVALVSGFSPAVLKMVMSDKLDPYECLVNMLNSKRYAPIEEILMQLTK